MAEYQPLTPETRGDRLSAVSAVADRLGGVCGDWTTREVGDGNLNLVFIVEGPRDTVIVKQALPYVRMVGDSWPMPLYRSFYEYQALTRQHQRDPGAVPRILHHDADQALIVMEFLQPHIILRRKLIAGERVAGLGERLGAFCARTAFRGSELSMQSADKKADVALFSGNVEIPAITEALVFCDPYFEAELNHHSAGLDPVVADLRADAEMKGQVQRLFTKFASNMETMLHGDLHTGSVMCTDRDTRVIDPEFSQYGPMGFDLGMLIANFLMAYISQPAHRGADLAAYQSWILEVIDACVATFRSTFSELWHSERTGMLYPRTLFEDQGQSSDAALQAKLDEIWVDAMGFCGIEMHRRVLSLAHNADFEEIEDPAVKVALETQNLRVGQALIKTAATVADCRQLHALVRSLTEAPQ